MKTCAKHPPKLAVLKIVVSFEQLVGLFLHVVRGSAVLWVPGLGYWGVLVKLEQTLLQAAAQSLLCYYKSGYKMPF